MNPFEYSKSRDILAIFNIASYWAHMSELMKDTPETQMPGRDFFEHADFVSLRQTDFD
jgi:hypothetical protein